MLADIHSSIVSLVEASTGILNQRIASTEKPPTSHRGPSMAPVSDPARGVSASQLVASATPPSGDTTTAGMADDAQLFSAELRETQICEWPEEACHGQRLQVAVPYLISRDTLDTLARIAAGIARFKEDNPSRWKALTDLEAKLSSRFVIDARASSTELQLTQPERTRNSRVEQGADCWEDDTETRDAAIAPTSHRGPSMVPVPAPARGSLQSNSCPWRPHQAELH